MVFTIAASSETTAHTLVGLAIWVFIIAAIALAIRASRRRRRRRDEDLRRQWDQLRHYAGRAPGHGAALGQVRRHRQRARRGLKAYVFWPATGEIQAAWFWFAWPPVGSYVLAHGSWAPGDHHNERVFYVQQGELRAVVDRRAPAAWERHRRRLERRAAASARAVPVTRADATLRHPKRPT